MKIFTCFLALAAFAFVSCKKPATVKPADPVLVNTDMVNGLNDDPSTLNGYFYVSYNETATSPYGYLTGYSAFNDPGNDLTRNMNHYTDNQSFINDNSIAGNINMGNVIFNQQALNITNTSISIDYRLFNNTTQNGIPSAVNWYADGNGTFKGGDMAVSRGFPKFTFPPPPPGSYNTYTVTSSQNLTINVKDVAANFDSLFFFLGNSNFVGNSIRKAALPATTSVTFTQAEIQNFYSGGFLPTSVFVVAQAFNYSNKTVNSKVYLFEVARKMTLNVYVTP